MLDKTSRRRVALLVVVGVVVGGSFATPAVTSATATDTDRDGLTNTFERWRSLTSPTRADTDRDGVWDGREDLDRDGLTNRAEQNLGTKPRAADTDRDADGPARPTQVHD